MGCRDKALPCLHSDKGYRARTTDIDPDNWQLTTDNYNNMDQQIGQIAILVNDYDEAIDFYRDKLHFQLIEDTVLSETKRWVVMKPEGNGGCNILLAKAASEEQKYRIGNQTGGRVFLFLYTDDLERDYINMKSAGIEFERGPVKEDW